MLEHLSLMPHIGLDELPPPDGTTSWKMEFLGPGSTYLSVKNETPLVMFKFGI